MLRSQDSPCWILLLKREAWALEKPWGWGAGPGSLSLRGEGAPEWGWGVGGREGPRSLSWVGGREDIPLSLGVPPYVCPLPVDQPQRTDPESVP